MRDRHQYEKPYDGRDQEHRNHRWIAKVRRTYHKCGGDIALPGSQTLYTANPRVVAQAKDKPNRKRGNDEQQQFLATLLG